MASLAAAADARPPAIEGRNPPAARWVACTGCCAAQLAVPRLRAGLASGRAATRAPAPASAAARVRNRQEKRASPAGVALAARLRAPAPELARTALGAAVLVTAVI